MRCPLCNDVVTEKELDSNVKKNYGFWSKNPPFLFWVCPKCDKILAITKVD